MQLTIFYSTSKAKQVIKLSTDFLLDQKGQRITYYKMLEKAKDLAFDITGGAYLDFSLDVPRFDDQN